MHVLLTIHSARFTMVNPDSVYWRKPVCPKPNTRHQRPRTMRAFAQSIDGRVSGPLNKNARQETCMERGYNYELHRLFYENKDQKHLWLWASRVMFMQPLSLGTASGLRLLFFSSHLECAIEKKMLGWVEVKERRNVERLIFRNFKITNIKITKDELFDSFIFEFIFLLFMNYLHNLIIFQVVKLFIFEFAKF